MHEAERLEAGIEGADHQPLNRPFPGNAPGLAEKYRFSPRIAVAGEHVLAEHDVRRGLFREGLENYLPPSAMPLVELGVIGHRELDRLRYITDETLIPARDGRSVASREITYREVKA